MRFDVVQTNTVGQGSINVQGLRCNFNLLVLGHGVHGEHVVVTICNFNDDDPYIIMKGQQHFSKILRLLTDVLIFLEVGYFGESVNNSSHCFPEHSFNIRQGVRSVLNYIVQ